MLVSLSLLILTANFALSRHGIYAADIVWNNTIVCRGKYVTISCPHGTILEIYDANYGRTSSKPCWGNSVDTKCVMSNKAKKILTDFLKEQCYEENSCKIKNSRAVFGNHLGPVPHINDQCYYTEKYMEVEYRCAEIGNSEWLGAVFCQGEKLKINCHNEKILEFHSAKYGRTGLEECGVHKYDDKCSLAVSKKLRKLCYYDSCSLDLTDDVFGSDPCPGKSKYLHVQYRCTLEVIDGDWAAWTTWSKCSVVCGGGKRNRTRTCTNPEPKNGGKDCHGSKIQFENCNEYPCLSTEKPTEPPVTVNAWVLKLITAVAIGLVLLFIICFIVASKVKKRREINKNRHNKEKIIKSNKLEPDAVPQDTQTRLTTLTDQYEERMQEPEFSQLQKMRETGSEIKSQSEFSTYAHTLSKSEQPPLVIHAKFYDNATSNLGD